MFFREKEKDSFSLFYVRCSWAYVMFIIHFHIFKLKFIIKYVNSFFNYLAGIHDFKKKTLKQKANKRSLDYDPIGPVAKAISSENWLLCLDEFQVNLLLLIKIFIFISLNILSKFHNRVNFSRRKSYKLSSK